MVSEVDRAKRALVAVFLLAGVYSVRVDLNRDCEDSVLRKAYRALSRKVRPDKGGQQDHQQKLNAAYEAWCEALRTKEWNT